MRFVPTRSGPVLWMATAALLALSSIAMAGNGKLAGTVTDASGQPLVGANVVTTVGTTPQGTTTDDEGKYFILNIPPGVYTVTASYIGYKSLVQTDVSVGLDLTSAVDFKMERQTIAGQVVTIVAEAPLVEKSRTSSRSSINLAELNNTMPVSDLSELVETAPSVFNGFIRGGRKGDVCWRASTGGTPTSALVKAPAPTHRIREIQTPKEECYGDSPTEKIPAGGPGGAGPCGRARLRRQREDRR